MPDFNLQNKTVLVTGASRGIGSACAEAFAQEGADVIAVARTAPETDIEGIRFWQEDVTKESFFERIRSMEKLDILINNAGTNQPEPIQDVTQATLDRVINLNLRAVFLASQAALRVMRPGACIINMRSQMGHVGSPNRTVYCMTKHAIEGLTKSLAVELAPKNIRVNSIAPTFVDTPMTRPMFEDEAFSRFVIDRIPMQRIGTIDEIVNAVLFLSSNVSSLTTGHSLVIDGGWTAQ